MGREDDPGYYEWMQAQDDQAQYEAEQSAAAEAEARVQEQGATMDTINITAVWLRRGDNNCVEVLVEIDGHWRLVITERIDSNFGHIAEAVGNSNWPLDSVTEEPKP